MNPKEHIGSIKHKSEKCPGKNKEQNTGLQNEYPEGTDCKSDPFIISLYFVVISLLSLLLIFES